MARLGQRANATCQWDRPRLVSPGTRRVALGALNLNLMAQILGYFITPSELTLSDQMLGPGPGSTSPLGRRGLTPLDERSPASRWVFGCLCQAREPESELATQAGRRRARRTQPCFMEAGRRSRRQLSVTVGRCSQACECQCPTQCPAQWLPVLSPGLKQPPTRSRPSRYSG